MDSIYNELGNNYDTTRKPDPEITATLAAHLQIETGGRYLDIACGTGNYTVN